MNTILNSPNINKQNQPNFMGSSAIKHLNNKIKLSLAFNHNWKLHIIGVLSLSLFFETFCWFVIPNVKHKQLAHFASVFYYIYNIIFVLCLPELISLFITIKWLKLYHKLFQITYLKNDISSFIYYQIKLLPASLLAFFAFFPVTIHIRYFIKYFGNYSLLKYQDYIKQAFAVDTYFIYLPFIIIVGYTLANFSLFQDLIAVKNTASILPKFPEINKEIHKESIPQILNDDNEQITKSEFADVVEVKGNTGNILLRTNECIFFKTVGRTVEVHHPKGVYRISKPISVLEQELDPKIFFKGNRSYIINFYYIKSYSYWEKGKYIIQLNIPNSEEFIMPRAHLQNLKSGMRLLYL